MTPAKVTVAVFAAAAMFIAGYVTNSGPTASAGATTAKPCWYTCPMHPDYRSESAGDCPVCGMRLQAGSSSAAASARSAAESRMVRISASQQQLIGVRTDVVRSAPDSAGLRLLGRIEPDTSKIYRLIAATDGWVRELGRNPAGALVKPNEALASYFVRDLVSTQQNYLYAYQTSAQVTQTNQAIVVPQRTSATLNLRLALDSLRSLGMTDFEIEDLQKKGQPSPELHLYSPGAGLVLARNISPGQRFDKGAELYRIADLSRVWVTANVYDKDRELVRPGAAAMVRYGGREYRARMTDLLPEFDPQTRTLKTRFEVENPQYVLRPDMFVDVEIRAELPAGLTVPADAVIDSGRHTTVYMDRGNGVFEPRLIRTGWRFGDRLQVIEGLGGGERIVVSGTFLIDSESRLNALAAPASESAPRLAGNKDPVCGMQIDASAPEAIVSQHGGRKYAFCSPQCKRDFDAAPAKYAAWRPRT